MANGLRTQALLALALGAAGNWHPAAAAEFQCRNGDSVRRIELSGPETTQGAACEVRYWRNAKAPEPGRTLWRANQDTDFCAGKARQLVARLEAGGWTCSSSEQAASAAPMQAAGADPEPAPQAEPRPAAPAQITRAPESGPPDPTLRVKPPSPAAAQTEPLVLPTEPPKPAGAPSETSVLPTELPSPAAAQTEPLASDEPVAASPAGAKAALLDQIVEQTLHSVQELYGGQFQADFAAFGDLDGDELEDAAVLITYQADPKEYVQYLVAYLFDGETFQSVATRNVGGRFLDALRADLQGIADGKILVELEALDGGATCCATHPTAFALENGQLVEVDHPGAASLDSTSPAGKPLPG
jgi:hypothetical protein